MQRRLLDEIPKDKVQRDGRYDEDHDGVDQDQHAVLDKCPSRLKKFRLDKAKQHRPSLETELRPSSAMGFTGAWEDRVSRRFRRRRMPEPI